MYEVMNKSTKIEVSGTLLHLDHVIKRNFCSINFIHCYFYIIEVAYYCVKKNEETGSRRKQKRGGRKEKRVGERRREVVEKRRGWEKGEERW